MIRTSAHPADCRPRSGFTLIELLVVVAIIVSLLAILMPAMGKAFDASRRAVCASNLRQLAVASFTYAQSFRGQFPYRGANADPNPATWYTSSTGDYRRVWLGYIGGYTVDNPTELFFCPSNPMPFNQNFPGQRWPHNIAGVFRYQAGYNLFANIGSSWGTWRTGRNVVTSIVSMRPSDQLWGDAAEDKTVPLGSWRLINHPSPRGTHEFSTIGPAGIQNAAGDASVRWYSHPAETELASWAANGITGEWWGKRR